MIATYQKLWQLLSLRERRQAVLLLGMILLMALLDMIGVASIMPFMTVLANPEVVETNAVLFHIYRTVGFADPQSFLFFLGAVVFVVLLVSIAFKALTTYAQLRFSMMREYSIGRRLVAGYLRQPYAWFLNRHSADLGKTIFSEVEQVIAGAIIPMMQLIAQGAVVLALALLLFWVDPWLALVVGGVLGSIYGLIYRALRGYLSHIGGERVRANEERFSILSDAFGGIKEVKVGGLEDSYIRRFDRPAQRFASHRATGLAIAEVPRFALEALAFGGMLLVALYLLAGSGGLQKTLPIISLYAFAGYRLMPALQAVYRSITQLRFAGAALDALHADVTSLSTASEGVQAGNPIYLQESITLENISYIYPNASKPALVDLNLTISARSTIGLVGATGSGKSTTADLILGLLEPQRGTLAVDGTPIGANNRCQWQKTIGYVPQHIYLADDTVAANIAFGVPHDQIDQQAVERAAHIANLHEFVVEELPQGYRTTVGERGVRLSGGQRQRIGIARALYHDPQVLILDEATSALDSLTEKAVMEAVNNLGHEITIILIAHRLSTVRQCDCIYLLCRGRVIAQGNYEQLAEENEVFRSMAAK